MVAGGGGNCVKIKHNSTYETVYAHEKFSQVKKGRRVKLRSNNWICWVDRFIYRDLIYITVIVNGKKVNSQKTKKLPSGKILKGKREKI